MPNSLIDRGPHIGQPLLFFCCWHEGSVLFMEQFCIVSSVPLLQYRFLVLLSTLGASTSSSCNSRGEHRDFWVWSSCLGDSGVQQAEAWFVFFVFLVPKLRKRVEWSQKHQDRQWGRSVKLWTKRGRQASFYVRKTLFTRVLRTWGTKRGPGKRTSLLFFFTMCCQKGEIEDGALARRKR